MAWTSEELLRAVVDRAPGYVVVLEGPELVATYANQAALELLGRPIVGHSVREIYPGTQAVEVAERVYATGQSDTVTEEPMAIPGTPQPGRYFTRTWTPLKDSDGTVQAVLCVADDVTAQVQGRLAHQASEQRTRAELQRMVALFDEAPVMLAVVDPPDWTVAMANRQLREVIGGANLIGMPLGKRVSADNPTLAAIKRVYETGHCETVEVTSELFAGRSFFLSFVPVHTDGTIGHVMATCVDVTEQRRAKQEREAQTRALELAREEAVAAGLAKDQFLAMLGHELRNPLQPMLTAVQVMRLDGITSVALDMLDREVRYLTGLVDDLLDISRISRGVIKLKSEPLDIRSIVNRGLELASPLLEHRRHRVSLDLELRTVGVFGDLQRLTQVVSNLIQNAAKYSAPGSQIRIAAERINDRVILRVSDDGVGIGPDMLGRVFEAFVQADQPLSRSSGGLGVGLAIVKNIVEAHGGIVSVHSDGPGHGSTFVVDLPAIELGPANEAPSSRIVRGGARTPIRILIVDDNEEATNILEIGLGAIGHRITVAYDGPSALAVAKANPPQIALLDIGLPVMDGYQLGELLRAAHDIPIVAITGYGQPVDRERSRAAGFAAHLVKPVDLAELAEVIETLAGSRREA